MNEDCDIKAERIPSLQKAEETIEMTSYETNIKAENTGAEVPEIVIDNSYDGKTTFKILCVGDSAGWSKEVYIQDYNSSDETVNENPPDPLKKELLGKFIGVQLSDIILYSKSGKAVHLQVWNIPESEIFCPNTNMAIVYNRHSDGVIVFWDARSNSIESALMWKHYISEGLEQDIPFVLVVDNVFGTPARWMGEGREINSPKEMDSFCVEHGFLAWFEMLKRVAGTRSVFGQAISTLLNEIISKNNKAHLKHSCVLS